MLKHLVGGRRVPKPCAEAGRQLSECRQQRLLSRYNGVRGALLPNLNGQVIGRHAAA
jgi:hypothetical protein